MSKVVEFGKASEKYRDQKRHQAKEDKVADIRQQFEKAMPTKPTPVKDYLKKKRAKKKK